MAETNFNGVKLEQVFFNGVDLDKIYFNDVLVFEKTTDAKTYEIYVS